MKKYKIINSFLLLAVFLTGWFYLIRWYAIQEVSVQASAGPQEILKIGKNFFGDVTSGGGCSNMDPDTLASYKEELQALIVGLDAEELKRSYTTDGLEGRINTEQAVFDPEKIALSEGDLSSAFEEEGATGLSSVQDTATQASCELKQDKEKELFVVDVLTKPILSLGLEKIQKDAMDKLMAIINKVTEKLRKKSTESIKKVGKGFKKGN